MTSLRRHRIHRMAVLVSALLAVRIAYAGTDPLLNQKLEATIATVRTLKPSMERFNAAEQLADLTFKVRPASVSDATVNDLISLLDDSDEVVRMWAAAALGHLGRHAKVAIPKLLALLPEADCLEGDLTSGRTIRAALERMGVKLPPRPSYDDCHRVK